MYEGGQVWCNRLNKSLSLPVTLISIIGAWKLVNITSSVENMMLLCVINLAGRMTNVIFLERRSLKLELTITEGIVNKNWWPAGESLFLEVADKVTIFQFYPNF